MRRGRIGWVYLRRWVLVRGVFVGVGEEGLEGGVYGDSQV